MFSIIRWRVVHKTQAWTSNVKVRNEKCLIGLYPKCMQCIAVFVNKCTYNTQCAVFVRWGTFVLLAIRHNFVCYAYPHNPKHHGGKPLLPSARWAIVFTLCPASVRRASSTFQLVNTLQATFAFQSSWKCIRTFISIKSWTSSKLGHMR